MSKGDSADDPKGLISEAYKIDGITAEECRSIFLDWALSMTDDSAQVPAIERLYAQRKTTAADHPMTQVLHAARTKGMTPKRRGGWRGRRTQA